CSLPLALRVSSGARAISSTCDLPARSPALRYLVGKTSDLRIIMAPCLMQPPGFGVRAVAAERRAHSLLAKFRVYGAFGVIELLAHGGFDLGAHAGEVHSFAGKPAQERRAQD